MQLTKKEHKTFQGINKWIDAFATQDEIDVLNKLYGGN